VTVPGGTSRSVPGCSWRRAWLPAGEGWS